MRAAAAPPSSARFGRLLDGREVDAYTLANARGLTATVLTLGGIVQSVRAPDAQGRVADIVRGFPALQAYEDDRSYAGAIIGRYANRIAGGCFRLDGREHELSRNDGANTLHGGACGFGKAVWRASVEGARLLLSHVSDDGDQGFPGELHVTVAYELGGDSALRIAYEARTSKATVVNLTSHIYWNLSGDAAGDVRDHTLQVNADRFTPVDAQMIPLGTLEPVEGTLDLRAPRRLRDIVQASEPHIAPAKGLDHNFVLNENTTPAARLHDPRSGRALEIFTTEPGLQAYSGNHLPTRWSAIALETQHFPDAPNRPAFPSTVLRPGEVFRSSTTFRLGCA